jgi:uncharacterized protein YgiM (DUF1202 family)
MKPLNKKLLMYGGGAFVITIALYLLFRKKSVKAEINQMEDPTSPSIPSNMDLPSKVYTKSGTRVRKEPSTTSDILATYENGKQLTPTNSITKSDGLWYKVLEQGGWVRSDVVTK